MELIEFFSDGKILYAWKSICRYVAFTIGWWAFVNQRFKSVEQGPVGDQAAACSPNNSYCIPFLARLSRLKQSFSSRLTLAWHTYKAETTVIFISCTLCLFSLQIARSKTLISSSQKISRNQFYSIMTSSTVISAIYDVMKYSFFQKNFIWQFQFIETIFQIHFG